MPPPLGGTYPIDGVVDFSDFEMVYERDVEIRDNAGQGAVVKTTTLRWAITNDDRNIYFALEWTDDTYDHDYDMDLGPLIFDGIKLLFDNDGNGMLENGEDERTVIAASIGSQYVDQHASSGDETDLIGDGFSKLSYDPLTTIYQAEFLFPLTSDAEGQDADLSQLTRYNIILFEEMNLHNGTGNMGSAYGLGDDSATWPDLPVIAAQPHDYPEIPSGLTGLIVFLSDHEQSNREIYRFDPSTGEVIQVTDMPALFKENVSLSHDRSRIAFHGTEDKDDYTSYEIYTVDIDGTNLTQLTDNLLLDGHPGWSPDDTRIVYASFREGGIASIFEHLPKGIHYATNVEAFFSPWDIVEAQLDGGGEQTLLSDGWINWLPVYDPSGEYICYLKGSGYTAAYLMTRDGEQLGRFIADVTRLNYIDWK